MFCKNCGTEIKEEQKFCMQCGTPVEEKSEITDMNVSPNNDSVSGKKRGKAFWGILFGVEAVVFIVFFVLIFLFAYKMLDVEINSSMKNNLSVLEKYEYNIQNNDIYLTNEDEHSFIAMNDNTVIEYYVLDEDLDAYNQYSGLYNTIRTEASYTMYVESIIDFEDYKKYTLTTSDKIYILVLDDENVLYINGDKAFAGEYSDMLNEMGYVDVSISPFFIITIVLFGLAMIAGCCFIYWKIFVKAGIPGWYSIIPMVNVYYLYKLSFGRGSYFLTVFVPIVNVVFMIMLMYKIAKAFDKSDAFAILNIFLLPFTLQVIALDDSKYILHMRED